MRRGFKAWAEKEAQRIRGLLGINQQSRLPASLLASHLGATIVKPREIPGLTPGDLKQLLSNGRDLWSAITIDIPELKLIIINSSHSANRQESSLMHELAHLICNHQPAPLLTAEGLAIRTFNKIQEKEADWLGGCLHLPRLSLMWALASGMTTPEISAHFGASRELVTYRRRITGVDIQFVRTQTKFNNTTI